MALNLPTTRVTVTDVDMPFWSMVGFMIKWTVAAVPALFILFLLGVAGSFGGALFLAALQRMTHP